MKIKNSKTFKCLSLCDYAYDYTVLIWGFPRKHYIDVDNNVFFGDFMFYDFKNKQWSDIEHNTKNNYNSYVFSCMNERKK